GTGDGAPDVEILNVPRRLESAGIGAGTRRKGHEQSSCNGPRALPRRNHDHRRSPGRRRSPAGKPRDREDRSSDRRRARALGRRAWGRGVGGGGVVDGVGGGGAGVAGGGAGVAAGAGASRARSSAASPSARLWGAHTPATTATATITRRIPIVIPTPTAAA